MDLHKYLRELYEEKRRIDRVIRSLEELLEQQLTAPAESLRRRGRRPGMSEEERRHISERMRKYWAGKKAGDQESGD
jgi:hypothetical protein